MSKLFHGNKIDKYLQQKQQAIQTKINNIDEYELSNLNVKETTHDLINRYKITRPILEDKEVDIQLCKRELQKNDSPLGPRLIVRQPYPIYVAQYTLKFKGDHNLFNYAPQDRIGGPFYNVSIKHNYMVIEITTYEEISDNNKLIEKVKKEYINLLAQIKTNLENLDKDVNAYNELIKAQIPALLKNRITSYNKKISSIAKLNPNMS